MTTIPIEGGCLCRAVAIEWQASQWPKAFVIVGRAGSPAEPRP
jgi:hypothetical protein